MLSRDEKTSSTQNNSLPNESVAKLEKLIEEFDQNMKIVDFEIETESFYDLNYSANNIKNINNILADSSRILANIHAIRYEFTAEYQIKIYERIKRRFERFEEKRDKVHKLQEKLNSLMSNSDRGVSANITVNSPSTTGNKNSDIKIINRGDVIDMNLKTDFNEKLLDEVGANLREVDRNIRDTAVSLKGQGDTLKQSIETVEGTDNNVRKANATISRLSWGQRIQLILLNLIAILLFIGIIVLLVIRIINYKN